LIGGRRKSIRGGFSVPLQPQNGGTLGGPSYSLSWENALVTAYFSDTRTTRTQNPNAHILARTVPGPTLITPPLDQVVLDGATAQFSAALDDMAEAAFQWHRGGHPVEGATGPQLIIANAHDGGEFHVVIEHPLATIISPTAALRLISPGNLAVSITPRSRPGGAFRLQGAGLPPRGRAFVQHGLPAARGLMDWSSGPQVVADDEGKFSLEIPAADGGPLGFWRLHVP
jgi:hypothetical protein